MVAERVFITVEAFEHFVDLPENAEKNFEFIGGEIVEIPSNPYSSSLSSRFSGFFFVYLLKNDIARVTGEAGGYRVAGEQYAPDVGILLKSRQAELVKHGCNPNPPDLAVEVVSPTDSKEMRMIKVANYLLAGTTVCVAYPELKEVHVFAPGQSPEIFGINDTLDGGAILPGFTLAVKDMFAQ